MSLSPVWGVIGAVHAQGFNDFKPADNTYSGWNTDRGDPATFAIASAPDASGNALQIGVVPDANSNTGFSAYEGKQKTANIATGDWTVAGSLYVTSDMMTGASGNFYGTGLWSRDNNPDENSAFYGVLQFRENASTAGGGFYYSDSANNWHAIGPALSANSWYDLSMTQVGTTLDYYIDGSLVEAYNGASTAPFTGLQSVFLEDYNFGQTTNVYWRNVSASAPGPTPEPITMGLGLAGIGVFLRRRKKASAK